MGNRRRRKSELVVISWRDIPAQVTAESGDQREKLLLSDRFQHAIDRAATVAGLTETSAYVQEWRRHPEPLSGDLETELVAVVRSLEERYGSDALESLVSNGGLSQDFTDSTDAQEGPPGSGRQERDQT